jgi:hypothetical protein
MDLSSQSEELKAFKGQFVHTAFAKGKIYTGNDK